MQKLSEISEYFLQLPLENDIDYQKISDDLLELTNAKYAVFNIYDKTHSNLKTLSISKDNDIVMRINKALNVDISRLLWNYDPEVIAKQDKQISTRFIDLAELVGTRLPELLVKELQSEYKLGEVIVVKIVVNEEMIGDFVIIMEKGTPYEVETLVEYYSRQVGMSILQKRNHKSLIENQSINKEIITSISDGILIIDKHRTVTYQSANCERVFGWKASDLIGKQYKNFIYEDDIEMMREQFYSIMKNDVKVTMFECRIKDKDGSFRIVDITATNEFDNPSINGILVTFHDISERKAIENELKVSEEKYRLITENISDVIAVINLSLNKTTFVSPSIYQQRGYTVEEAMVQSIEDSLVPTSRELVQKLILEHTQIFLNNPQTPHELRTEVQQYHKDGHLIWVEILSRYQMNKDNEIEMLVVSRNIDERKKAEVLRTYFSLHDHLTGLYNRRFFEEELVRLDVERSLPMSIIMGDVNGLKLINDSFGHEIGDELLIKVAIVIKSQLREDEIFARLGGDEFAILLPHTDHATSKAIIHRIQEAIKKEKVANISLSISFGYDIKEKTTDIIVDVIKKAEDNMYRSKLCENRSSKGQTVDIIMEALFEKSPREKDHALRVRDLCEKFANALNFTEDRVQQIKKAAYVHDIGKIGIDADILNKSGKLNDKEMFMIRKHPEAGWRILNSVMAYTELSEFIMMHHEWVNGSGYPRGLKGDTIPLESRLLAIVDAYDVMTNPTSYKTPLSIQDAKSELNKYSGSQFDPFLVKMFIEKIQDV